LNHGFPGPIGRSFSPRVEPQRKYYWTLVRFVV
jgi:hypothetical protein